MAPNWPVLAPTTETVLFRSAASCRGREAQSIAFLSPPGIEPLYSGVANRIASAEPHASRRRTTGSGASPLSRSWSYTGSSAMPAASKSSTSTPSGAASIAARRSLVLYEPERKLPETARIFMVRPPP